MLKCEIKSLRFDMKMHETIPNKVELKVNTTDSKKVEHDLACSRRSDDGERAKNYSHRFFFSLEFLVDSTRTIDHTPHHLNVWNRLSMIVRENDWIVLDSD